MEVIRARGVNDAYPKGVQLLFREGDRQDSRAGKVRVAPYPVVTEYNYPAQRVLFDERRDANPFFHLFESLWMLAGSRDATWLDQFVGDFSSRFAEENGDMHGAYGFRWRKHFDMEGGGEERIPDQLETVIRLLHSNPIDRRVVLTMWDPVSDLDVNKKDIPCNTHVYFRVRTERQFYPAAIVGGEGPAQNMRTYNVLDMTVCCRSNDAIWGAYGANAVHFSMLQEYIAGRLSVAVGRYYQLSNNFHLYEDVAEKMGLIDVDLNRMVQKGVELSYPMSTRLVTNPDFWMEDLRNFLTWTLTDKAELGEVEYANVWFRATAERMYKAHRLWKQKAKVEAAACLESGPNISQDWRKAALDWFGRRIRK